MAMNDIHLNQFLDLGDQLAAAGYKTPAVFEKAHKITEGMRAAINEERYIPEPETLYNLTPEEAGELLRNATVNRVNREAARQMWGNFDARLATGARKALNETSADLVKAMRQKFNSAAAIVKLAAEAGLSESTDPAALLNSGSPAALAVYRDLGPAIQTLDEIAALRNRMTEIGGVGPSDYIVAAFVTNINTPQQLKTAGSILKGSTRLAEVTQGRWTNQVYVPVQRLGGAWLALVVEGVDLRLNTGPEAAKVVTAANADAAA